MGSGGTGTPLQTVDYQYNVRGWLTDINDINSMGADLFAFKMGYNTVSNNMNGLVSPLYNGNISETKWLSAADNIVRKYGYKYDKLSRMTVSFYQKPGQIAVDAGSYNENVSYDKNGNIRCITLTGGVDDYNTTVQISLYTYKANSNRLDNVHDYSTSPQGFRDYEDFQHLDYSYDDNGNLKTDKIKV